MSLVEEGLVFVKHGIYDVIMCHAGGFDKILITHPTKGCIYSPPHHLDEVASPRKSPYNVRVSDVTFAKIDEENLWSALRCKVCDKEAEYLCQRCHGVKYCGAGCQKADWIQHKSICKQETKNMLMKEGKIVRPDEDSNGKWIE